MFTRSNFQLLLTVSLLGLALPASAQKYVCMEMNVGDICMELHPSAAPLTVANFLKYVNDGDYTDSLVHRSEPDFVIQGGGYYGGLSNLGMPVPSDPPIQNEFSLSNTRGTVAMAKLGNDPHSATSEWYINLVDNTYLDFTYGGFTVFATVVTGMDIVDKISALRLVDLRAAFGSHAYGSVPVSTDSLLIGLEDFVLVKRAYATDVLPGSIPAYRCSAGSPADTLTEFCGTHLTFPVNVDGQLYDATLRLSASSPELVFNVDKATLKPIADTGQEHATYNAQNQLLTIPSVRSGALAFVNVQLLLTNAATLEFTLTGLAPR